MNYLFAAATKAEINLFINYCRKNSQRIPKDTSIDFLITGVGMLQTAYSLTKQILTKRPDIVVQSGIAGCFDKKQDLAQIWLVKDEYMADLGVEKNGFFEDSFDLKLIKANQFPFLKKRLKNPHKKILASFGHPTATAVTVNEITTSKKRISILKEKYNPLLESMEGAALHYVCLSENIPFVQLRSTSNYIAERDKSKWMLKEAIKNINQELIRFVDHNCLRPLQ